MRNIIISLLLRLMGRKQYKPLSEKQIDTMLAIIAKDPDLKRFPDFLQQCADTNRNQYLYTENILFKGAVFGIVSIHDRVEKAFKKVKEEENKNTDLHKREKSGKIRKEY